MLLIPLRPPTTHLRLLTLMATAKRLEPRGTTSFASTPIRPTTCALSRKEPKSTLRRTLSFVTQTQARTHLHRRAKDRYSLDTKASGLSGTPPRIARAPSSACHFMTIVATHLIGITITHHRSPHTIIYVTSIGISLVMMVKWRLGPPSHAKCVVGRICEPCRALPDWYRRERRMHLCP